MKAFYLALITLTATVANAEIVESLWNGILNHGKKRSVLLWIELPTKPQTLTIYRGENSEPLNFKISTGREEFELPTSPLIDPYCSFTPTGTSFKPQRLVPNHISNTWEDAEMPNSVFFHGGIALHGTTTKDGNKSLAKQLPGAVFALAWKDSKKVFDLVQANGSSDGRGRMTYRNVNIEVVDRRSKEEIQKIEKQCKDTKQFWVENCKPELLNWRVRCDSVYRKESPTLRHCLKLRREDPKNQKAGTPQSCERSDELKSCLSDFIAHRNKCKGSISKWQKANSNETEINNTPPPGSEVRNIPLPPQRPSDLGSNTPATQPPTAGRPMNINPVVAAPLPPQRPSDIPRPPADIPSARTSAPARNTTPQSAQRVRPAEPRHHSDLWSNNPI